jgi:hypothetical protein
MLDLIDNINKHGSYYTTTMAKSWSWDSYGRKGLDIVHSASTFGFSAAKVSTRLGVSVVHPCLLLLGSHVVSSFLLQEAWLLVSLASQQQS